MENLKICGHCHPPDQPIGPKRNQREIRKYLETKEDGNTTYHNLWGAAKAVLIEKFIVINTHIKKQQRSLKKMKQRF